MTYPRQKIRHALRDRLAATNIVKKVFAGRAQVTHAKEMPFINVLTGSETCERPIDASELRTVQVFIKIYTNAAEGIYDELDSIAYAVESVLEKDSGLSGIVENFEYSGADPDAISASDTENGELTLNYTAQYLREPDPIADDLVLICTDIDMADPRNDPQFPPGPDGQIDASVTIEFPN